MLESFPIALAVSTVLGFLAGIGVGGGSLLILWLTLVLEMDYPQARIVNLLFFLPAAAINTIFRCRQGTLQLRTVWPGMVAGCVSAAVCVWLSTQIGTELLRKFFGALLLVTGIRELLYKPKTRQK